MLDGPRHILETYSPVSDDLNEQARADKGYNEIHVTPEDGRYADKLVSMRAFSSEAQLARFRLMIEAEWFRELVKEVLPPELFDGMENMTKQISVAMGDIADKMTLSMANRITAIEAKSRHDVIAMITAMREEIEKVIPVADEAERAKLQTLLSYVHLGLTSEDVTSPSHSLMLLNTLRQLLTPKMNEMLAALRKKALDFDSVRDPNNATASMGLRYREYASNLEDLAAPVLNPDYLTVKFAGATGTHSALKEIAGEGKDPRSIAANFIAKIAPELHYLPVTAQINPHDDLSIWAGQLRRFCEEMRWICEEIWEDSGRDVLTADGTLQKLLSVKTDTGQSGSSAMPQKVQVINIENAKGTAQALAAIARGLHESININRLQRELSDSRQIREVFGDVLPKLLQIIQNMAVDIPKLTVNDACREPDPPILQQESKKQEKPKGNGLHLSTVLTQMRHFLASAAVHHADVAMLARTHNQPASPTTFGKELRVFAERMSYLENLANGKVGNRTLENPIPDEDIQTTASGVLEQFLGDMRIYSSERNGLVTYNPDYAALDDPRKFQLHALMYLGSPIAFTSFVESIEIDGSIAERELEAHYESLGEAIQTILRRYGVYNAYEIVKKKAQGSQMNRAQYQHMITDILGSADVQGKIPADVADRLLNLTPKDFIGEAAELAKSA